MFNGSLHSLSFTQGFLLGQASVVLLVFVFLKYFIFGDAGTVKRGRRKEKDERRIRGHRQGHGKGQRKGNRRKGRSVSVGTTGSDEIGSSNSSSSISSGDEDYSGIDKQDQPSSTAATDATTSVLRLNRPLSAAALLEKTYYHARQDSRSSRIDADHRSEFTEHHQQQHQDRRKRHQYRNKHQKNQHKHHDPESLDWFNVLVAQTIAQLHADACSNNILLVRSLTEALNGNAKPDWMDEIRVTKMSLGEEFPIFRNCRIVHGRPAGVGGQGGGDVGNRRTLEGVEVWRKWKETRRKKSRKILQAHMDVELKDAITLGLETRLVLNYPRPLAAMLPVGLVVEVVRFEGTLSISFDSSSPDEASSSSSSYSAPRANLTAPTLNKQSVINHGNHDQYESDKHNNRNTTTTTTEPPIQSETRSSSNPAPSSPSLHLNLTFLPDYTLDLAIRSQLGSRSRIQDIPKIGQLVEQRLLAWFEERFVAPGGGWKVGVPRLFDNLRMERKESEGVKE